MCLVTLGAQTGTRKKRAAPRPAVTAAMRAAARKKVDQYLEDSKEQGFEQPGTLVPAFEQLYRIGNSEDHAAVHILHFGDSHTAADEWTGGLREQFQQRFGNGGPGYSLAGHPFPGYRRFDVHGGGTLQWHTVGGHFGNGDGFFGLGGVAITAQRAGQSVFVETECDRLEVDFLEQPDGGRLELFDNDQRVDEFSTGGELGAGAVAYDVAPGEHRFKLLTLDSRPVRLFGWACDKKTGVTYEALGLNGAEASVMMKWDPAMLATYLQRRNPGLIVLAYGANEASDPNWSQESYGAMFSSLLERLRQDAPAASILALGPADRWYRTRAGWRPYPGIDRIVAAQKEACRANRVGYWDTRERMGGQGSMRDWVYAGLGQADYVHFTAEGYRRLAVALYADLMEQYGAFERVRSEDPSLHGHAN